MDKLTGKKVIPKSSAKSVNGNENNFFANKLPPMADVWDFIDASSGKNIFSGSNSIDSQIEQIKAQTQEYKKMLDSPHSLNVMG